MASPPGKAYVGSCSAEYLPINEQSRAHCDEAVPSTQAANQPEYEYDFVNKPSQDFYCPVTLELLLNPQQTTCCGNHLSQEASARLQRGGKPCPMCKEANLATMPDKFYKRKVNELQVRCPHKTNECKWVGSLSDLNQHCNSCPKRTWACKYCDFRATYEVGVNNHLPNCPKCPEPCPNHCDIGTVERCNLENHLRECPLQVVECEAGCSVRVPRRDLGRHMEESGQQHLVAMSLLNLRLTRELHQKMEEKDRQITELREQLEQQGRDMRNHIQTVETRSDIVLQLMFPTQFECVITEFSKMKAKKQTWYSDAFYTRPHFGHKFRLAVDANGQGDAQGTHLSVDLLLEKGEFDSMVYWPIRFTGRLLLLNQLGSHDHHVVSFNKQEISKGKKLIRISGRFIPQSELGYNAAKNVQYLKDDCLCFRLYMNITHS